MAGTPLTNHHAAGHHITPPSTYWKVFGALTILMIATVFVALKVQVPDIGPIPGVWINNLIAIAIAVLKAYLVIMVFMGVGHGTKLTKLWAIAGFAGFALMFFILADNFTRNNEAAPGWVEEQSSALSGSGDSLESREVNPNEINLRPRQ